MVSVPASAHLPVLHGKLLDLVQRSDVILIGTADSVIPIGTSNVDTTVRIAEVLVGSISQKQLTFRGPTRFAPGARYVFFLRRTAEEFAALQDAGTVFPCSPGEERLYRSTITALVRAMHSNLATRADAIRAALLPALAAPAAPLRYHAALELRALANGGHPPNAAERLHLEQLLRDPATDAALRPLLTALVQTAITPPPRPAASQ